MQWFRWSNVDQSFRALVHKSSLQTVWCVNYSIGISQAKRSVYFACNLSFPSFLHVAQSGSFSDVSKCNDTRKWDSVLGFPENRRRLAVVVWEIRHPLLLRDCGRARRLALDYIARVVASQCPSPIPSAEKEWGERETDNTKPETAAIVACMRKVRLMKFKVAGSSKFMIGDGPVVLRAKHPITPRQTDRRLSMWRV